MSKTLLALAALDYAADKKMERSAFVKASTVRIGATNRFLWELHKKNLISITYGKVFEPAMVELTFGGMQYLRNHAK